MAKDVTHAVTVDVDVLTPREVSLQPNCVGTA